MDNPNPAGPLPLNPFTALLLDGDIVLAEKSDLHTTTQEKKRRGDRRGFLWTVVNDGTRISVALFPDDI